MKRIATYCLYVKTKKTYRCETLRFYYYLYHSLSCGRLNPRGVKPHATAKRSDSLNVVLKFIIMRDFFSDLEWWELVCLILAFILFVGLILLAIFSEDLGSGERLRLYYKVGNIIIPI